MELYAQQPYWLMKSGIFDTFTSLNKNLDIDVAIIGGGISGALSAYYLRNAGLSVALFDRRHAGMGSTAASTAFLQYEIDTPLRILRNYVGEENAVQSYRLCRKAIYDIQKICNRLKPEFDFHIRPSLQYASYQKDTKYLHEEYQLRKKHGFDIDWLEQEDIRTMFGIDAPSAVLSVDGGEVDAYLLTHALLNAFKQRGHQVYNNTEIRTIDHQKRYVTLRTEHGHQVKAKKLIIASGYESLKYIPKTIAKLHSTYALITEPLHNTGFWHKKSLVWETASPYLYFRVVSGNRLLIGGKDDEFHDPHILPSRVKQKADLLLLSFSKKMPNLPVKKDLAWGGAFAITKDGLPYIGSIPERPHTYFALGFGGNGITFSIIAAEIIKDSILNRKNNNARIFQFNR